MEFDNTSPVNETKNQDRINEALAILKDLGLPHEQHNERSALTFLALLMLKPEDNWSEARNPLLRTRAIMDFIGLAYNKNYAANSRETIRKQTLHQFVAAGLAEENFDKPDRPTNSPQWNYRIRENALVLVRSYNTDGWSNNLQNYLALNKPLIIQYAQEREMNIIPIRLESGESFTLSQGGQNILIKDILNDFCPRFTPGGTLLYVGDTADKWGQAKGYANIPRLEALGLTAYSHGKMPDVVVYYEKKNWLVLIEAVTSHGAIDHVRKQNLTQLFATSGLGLVFVTVFSNRREMLKYLPLLSWETEVWLADNPTHMIHFNGDRFLGPH